MSKSNQMMGKEYLKLKRGEIRRQRKRCVQVHAELRNCEMNCSSQIQVKRREEIEAQEQENLLGARNLEQERIQVGE